MTKNDLLKALEPFLLDIQIHVGGYDSDKEPYIYYVPPCGGKSAYIVVDPGGNIPKQIWPKDD